MWEREVRKEAGFLCLKLVFKALTFKTVEKRDMDREKYGAFFICANGSTKRYMQQI